MSILSLVSDCICFSGFVIKLDDFIDAVALRIENKNLNAELTRRRENPDYDWVTDAFKRLADAEGVTVEEFKVILSKKSLIQQ